MIELLQVRQASGCIRRCSDSRADLVAWERAYALRLQREGKWPHLWRIAGEYDHFSVFDVESNDELHDLLSALPLFPYLDIDVTAPARHPSKAD